MGFNSGFWGLNSAWGGDECLVLRTGRFTFVEQPPAPTEQEDGWEPEPI